MNKRLTLLVALTLLSLTSTSAEIIFDNSDNFELKINSTPFESGDQVHFAGDSRVLDFFAFEYFASATVTNNGGMARVRFYLNDGPMTTNGVARAPGTLLYDSGSFLIDASAAIQISGLNIYVPSDTMTWTVQFSGIRTNERAGLRFFDPPRTGTSENFLWQKESDQWRMIPGTNDVVYNLSARFVALPAVRIKALQAGQNGVTITAAAAAGKNYTLEFKTRVDQAQWSPIERAPVRAEGPEVTLTDPSGTGGRSRIYRVVERD